MIRVQAMPFDPGGELNVFSASVAGAGAIVSFTGVVRDVAGGLSGMEIEHYPGMTEKALSAIRGEAMQRWDLADALVIHRIGQLEAHESIMMVATASQHRKSAFEAAEFLMDYLKSRAPFWKKEITLDGSDWVDSKAEDEDALSRW
ncbi:molybdopterin-converting factor subunit MoaE [Octadecabacter antarcticus 307]|uniref:Molybdopterin synthase catalytic subunit n=1 Tax=Octadecabacter antarcticus 307 TaxID=391626 RepID=M9QZZ5_9RHOB|nr:molybdenum cofactor biosynthesis protein MoaE [Octadecabacter antarcticus]AGI65924.1 molybdopterin-converting factor subunit MoaE [Octadecabacter antarcticus 307]